MNYALLILAQFQQRSNCSETEAAKAKGTKTCISTLPEVRANDAQVQKGLTILFGIFAAVAVIIIIVAAINLAASDGNPENISKSKRTIIYALIGLVIALSAETAVLTLLGRI